jgi:quinol monooxygenase YgiN
MTEHHPFTIVATFEAKPETAERLRAELLALTGPTRAEKGCLGYRLYVDPAEPTSMVMVEKWSDLDAIAAHNKAPHLQEFMKIVPNLVARTPGIEILKPARD